MTETFLTLTDQTIQAYVDNQLKWEDAKKVRVLIDGSSFALKREQELRDMKVLLQLWHKTLS